jgi:hypothetical protein
VSAEESSTCVKFVQPTAGVLRLVRRSWDGPGKGDPCSSFNCSQQSFAALSKQKWGPQTTPRGQEQVLLTGLPSTHLGFVA